MDHTMAKRPQLSKQQLQISLETKFLLSCNLLFLYEIIQLDTSWSLHWPLNLTRGLFSLKQSDCHGVVHGEPGETLVSEHWQTKRERWIRGHGKVVLPGVLIHGVEDIYKVENIFFALTCIFTLSQLLKSHLLSFLSSWYFCLNSSSLLKFALLIIIIKYYYCAHVLNQ